MKISNTNQFTKLIFIMDDKKLCMQIRIKKVIGKENDYKLKK